jgi:hypothetical protein
MYTHFFQIACCKKDLCDKPFTNLVFDRLYWADKSLGLIQCMDYEGNNRIEVIKGSGQSYDVTIFQVTALLCG